MTRQACQNPLIAIVSGVWLLTWPTFGHSFPEKAGDKPQAAHLEGEGQIVTIPVQDRKIESLVATLWGVEGRLLKRSVTYADGHTVELALGFESREPNFEVRLFPESFEPQSRPTPTAKGEPKVHLKARMIESHGSLSRSDLLKKPRWACEDGEIPGVALIRSWTPDWQDIANCHLTSDLCPKDQQKSLESLATMKVAHVVVNPLLDRGVPLCVALTLEARD